ncbi:MAG: epoxyqueuosine reductase QueH, partial [Clostridia bacterium]|nr:epoxyqueuosine reductase QueH [Clostridia bacterium]
MNKRNYSKELDALIEKNKIENKKPTLMLHVCCAVCASYVLEYLYEHFQIKICYFNPN